MTRRSLLRKIRLALSDRLYKSGYRTGPVGASRPYRVAPLAKTLDLHGFVVRDFEGFAEDGVVEEFYVGCATIFWGNIPIEDLSRLLAVVSDVKTPWRKRTLQGAVA